MRKLAPIILAFVLFLSGTKAHADQIVLIHGYLGEAYSWQASGVVPILESRGWPLADLLLPNPPWILPVQRPDTAKAPAAKHTVHLAQLPSLAPLALQAVILEAELQQFGRAHPGQEMILVGHSAGGVVARLALIRHQLPPVKALITIAAPHLGTPRAESALDAISDPWPLEVIKEFFVGGPYPLLRESSGLLFDLTRPFPGSLLFALNNTPHPDIRYISLIRSQPFAFGDTLVPGFSQDMNQVPALHGKSQVALIPGDHPLHPGDGLALERILRELTKPQ
ncbi:MAG: alpha/beta fold hydrolase [Magnetococcales bacterium]|nr:alpha/beta fold hydrolase [Magnetococcales bacterium]